MNKKFSFNLYVMFSKNKLLLVIIELFFSFMGYSQSCLPNGIIFTTQYQIDNFEEEYPECISIDGGVSITGNNITNLMGLNMITSVQGLYIHNTSALIDLQGLDNLTSIFGGLTIIFNDTLSSLNGLENLTFIENQLWIGDNPYLSSLSGLENITTLNEWLQVDYNGSLTSLTGLNNLTYVGSDLYIHGNTSLIDFSGLDNLSIIGGEFQIIVNRSLVSFSGLESLTSIGSNWGRLFIDRNILLSSIMGLENVTSIGGGVLIRDNSSLTNLNGLDNVSSIGGSISILSNNSLNNLDGLANVNENTINYLSIEYNDSLSTCNVSSICEYLASPNGTIDIHDNAPGCNSQQEVETDCGVGLDESSLADKLINIFPNPLSTKLNIEIIESSRKSEFTIINVNGQSLHNFRISESFTTIDLSHLQSGVYFMKYTCDNKVRIFKCFKY